MPVRVFQESWRARPIAAVVAIGCALAACDDPPGARRVQALQSVAPLAPSDVVARQRLYVPAYSEIHFRDDRHTIVLAVTLSVRNTDDLNAIDVQRVDYHDDDGRLVRAYVDQPFRLAPLASAEFVVPYEDTSGGVSPSFIVEWVAATPVVAPLVETIMIGVGANLGISFAGQARVLSQTLPPRP